MPTIAETIQATLDAHGDSRLKLSTEDFFEKQTRTEWQHHYIKAGAETLFKIIIPKPQRPPFMIEEYHEDPAVVHGHPVTKAFMLGPILAGLLANSKETKAILERVTPQE